MARVIALSNHKGGVGKTTSTVNIGAGLSYNNQKVLVIDLDSQANLTQSLHLSPPLGQTIYGALRGQCTFADIFIHHTENLTIVPSELDLSGAEIELSSEAGREFILRELIAPHLNDFDFILVDCPPSLGLLTVNAFTAVKEVFLPLQAEYLAMQGLAKLIEVINKVKSRLNPALDIGGVFVTQYDHRKVLNRNVLGTIQKYFGNILFDTKIRDNVALAEAPTSGKDIYKYAPKSYGAEDYDKLVLEIMARKPASEK